VTDPYAEFDAAQARLQAIRGEARANARQAALVADEARTTTATARSPRGEVSVTSRAGGVITGIEFSEAALELEPAALSRLTVTTIAQAQHEAAADFARTAGEQLGDPALAASFRADAETAFPQPGTGLSY